MVDDHSIEGFSDYSSKISPWPQELLTENIEWAKFYMLAISWNHIKAFTE